MDRDRIVWVGISVLAMDMYVLTGATKNRGTHVVNSKKKTKAAAACVERLWMTEFRLHLRRSVVLTENLGLPWLSAE